MNPFIPLILSVGGLVFGAVAGYYARQSIAQRQIGTLEEKIQKKIAQTKQDVEKSLKEAKDRAEQIVEKAKREETQSRQEILKSGQFLLKREDSLDRRTQTLENKEQEFIQKAQELKKTRERLEELNQEAAEKLEKVAGLSQGEAKQELIAAVERNSEQEVMDKMRKLEQQGNEKYSRRAKEILSFAVQRYALSQVQELTTTTVGIPSDEMKGRIIGKEGRNIRTLERLTGVEIVVDDTPEAVVISGFDPVRRQIAKMALEKLLQDGRIQPARIEEVVAKAESEIVGQIKEAGETAIYETGIVGLDPKLTQLLGRLKFRTSYGQNVLLHSIEVAHLAGALAAEIGANVTIAKKAGLLHDIGKAVDHQIQGSHTDIGIKILEKFGEGKDIILAMRSHHEEYPAENLEAILVQTADQISGARPGARRDTLENYIQRLEELEKIATSFFGVDKAYAIQAGREIRVLVNSEEISDLSAKKLARDIADRVQDEIKFPGEIKVNVIRETRVIEYAR
ncbi:MAG: ribonuclease Y [Patescibacteria group bacterium]